MRNITPVQSCTVVLALHITEQAMWNGTNECSCQLQSLLFYDANWNRSNFPQKKSTVCHFITIVLALHKNMSKEQGENKNTDLKKSFKEKHNRLERWMSLFIWPMDKLPAKSDLFLSDKEKQSGSFVCSWPSDQAVPLPEGFLRNTWLKLT